MAGGETTWVEYEPTGLTKNYPAKGGTRNPSSITVSGKASLLIGKVARAIKDRDGTF